MPYRQIADALGIGVRTVAKWVARGRHAALADRSSRPHRSPRRLPATGGAILLWRQRRATAWEISRRVGVPRSTVSRVLRRVGLPRLAAVEAPPEVRRYEWPHAGDLLHLDIKVARIRGIGHRIHGDRARSQSGVGYEYVHVAIDDATRLAYVEVRRSQRRRACAGRGSSAIASPAPIRRVPTARPSASFRRCCASAPTGGPFPARRVAPRSRPSSTPL